MEPKTFLSTGLILALIFIIKTCLAGYYHCKIINAISDYNIDQIKKGFYVDLNNCLYDDMESLEATIFRLWDWGYKRILPKDKFETIKPHLKKKTWI